MEEEELDAAEECSSTTLSAGAQHRSSRSHCVITVAGQTMSTGPRSSRGLGGDGLSEARDEEKEAEGADEEACSAASSAATCTVFPRPISSPTMPPTLCAWSSQSHCTPVRW